MWSHGYFILKNKYNYQRADLRNHLLIKLFQIGVNALEIRVVKPENDFIHISSYSCNLENCLIWLHLVEI